MEEGPTGVPITTPVVAISTGGLHTCALAGDGKLYCWGWNRDGQLGDGSTSNARVLPVAVQASFPFAAVSGGGGHTCALTAADEPYCWGFNLNGQLGDGTTTRRLTPTRLAGSLGLTNLSTGGSFTCGVDGAGAAYCWGWGTAGQLGDGFRVDRHEPVAVVGGLTFTAVATGVDHACGLTTGGAAYCWGDNSNGQLGDLSTQSRTAPVQVTGQLSFQSLDVGSSHTCGLTTTGEAYCWGDNRQGQLGVDDEMLSQSLAPRLVVGGLTFASLSVGLNGAYSCGVATDGRGFCWGANGSGQLGYQAQDVCIVEQPVGQFCSHVPQEISGGLVFAMISAGTRHTCAVATSLTAYCWGLNSNGQLGDGSTSSRSAPVRVANQTAG